MASVHLDKARIKKGMLIKLDRPEIALFKYDQSHGLNDIDARLNGVGEKLKLVQSYLRNRR